MNKKAQFGILDYWVGLLSLFLLVLSAFFALNAKNSAVVIILALLIGLFFGAQFYRCRRQNKAVLPFVLPLIGIVIGYFLGAWVVGVSPIFLTLAIIVGIVLAYFVHTKDFIKT